MMARWLLLFILLALPVRAQDRVVNIYNWTDYIDPTVLDDFTIGAPATAAVAQQWRVRPTINPRLFLADLKILAQFNQRRGRQRNPARLVELQLADPQYTGSSIDIVKPRTSSSPKRNPHV